MTSIPAFIVKGSLNATLFIKAVFVREYGMPSSVSQSSYGVRENFLNFADRDVFG
jgi:hypothetical protein